MILFTNQGLGMTAQRLLVRLAKRTGKRRLEGRIMQKAITEYEEMSKHSADPLLTHECVPKQETSMATP